MLSEPVEPVNEPDFDTFVGRNIEKEICQLIASGEIDPITKRKFNIDRTLNKHSGGSFSFDTVSPVSMNLRPYASAKETIVTPVMGARARVTTARSWKKTPTAINVKVVQSNTLDSFIRCEPPHPKPLTPITINSVPRHLETTNCQTLPLKRISSPEEKSIIKTRAKLFFDSDGENSPGGRRQTKSKFFASSSPLSSPDELKRTRAAEAVKSPEPDLSPVKKKIRFQQTAAATSSCLDNFIYTAR
jgi:hypothetical protein